MVKVIILIFSAEVKGVPALFDKKVFGPTRRHGEIGPILAHPDCLMPVRLI
jgi:hypothetical protein